VLRRQKIKFDWWIPRVDHSFRRITGDNGDVQQGKKQRVFLSSAIEGQDFIAGEKGVSKDFPDGSALGTDPRAGKEVVIPPGEPVKRDDCLTLIFGGGSQAFTSGTAAAASYFAESPRSTSELRDAGREMIGHAPNSRPVRVVLCQGRVEETEKNNHHAYPSRGSSIAVNWVPHNLFHANRNNLTVSSRHPVDHS
jgi:hypothetical protein